MTERLVQKLDKETQLNNLIKNKRKQDFHLLYYSLWCKESSKVMSLVDEWKRKEGGEKLFLINSWDPPHAFTAFRVTKAPTLVKVERGRVHMVDYFPRIFSHFTVDSEIRQGS